MCPVIFEKEESEMYTIRNSLKGKMEFINVKDWSFRVIGVKLPAFH